MSPIKKVAGAVAAGVITIGLAAGPADAQTKQDGLVNVAVASAKISQDGLVNVAATDVNVQIPIAAAANICGVAVNVLATAANFGDVDCTTSGVALANNSGGGSGGPVRQRGLVNVALTDVNVQVPVTVAAAVCGVSVGVLAQAANVGDVVCESNGVSLAN